MKNNQKKSAVKKPSQPQATYEYSICECSYQDDYEEGEVNGTFNVCTIDHGTTTDLKKTIADFKMKYAADSSLNDGEKIWLDEDFIHTDDMKAAGDWGWRKPTEAEIELWKKGKFELWNVEWQLRFKEVRAVPESILKKAAKGLVEE